MFPNRLSATIALILPFVALAHCSSDGPGTDSDAGSDASSSADTSPKADGGDPALNGCFEYIDATTDPAKRSISWGLDTAPPSSCLKIKEGQFVTWKPVSTFDDHPLISFPSSSDSPIVTGKTSTPLDITFAKTGLYGFRCDFHSSMTGAIWVVP